MLKFINYRGFFQTAKNNKKKKPRIKKLQLFLNLELFLCQYSSLDASADQIFIAGHGCLIYKTWEMAPNCGGDRCTMCSFIFWRYFSYSHGNVNSFLYISKWTWICRIETFFNVILLEVWFVIIEIILQKLFHLGVRKA